VEVTAIRRSRSHSTMVDVCLSDGDRRRVHERRLLELGLSVGTPVDGETRSQLDRFTRVDSAEQRMLRLITRRGRSRAELVERLGALEIDDDSALEIVTRLERAGFIDDRALAAEVTDRTRVRGMGHLRTKHDLGRLQIDEQSAAEVLVHDPEAERSRAHAAVIKRYGAIPTTAADLARASGYLQRRGYDADTAATVLRLELE
jgi:regulatory protein